MNEKMRAGQFDTREDLVRVSEECCACGYEKYFDITEDQAKKYEDYCFRRPGFLLIQDIFPDMEKSDRELLRGNSYCKKCWERMFGKCPEDMEDAEE